MAKLLGNRNVNAMPAQLQPLRCRRRHRFCHPCLDSPSHNDMLNPARNHFYSSRYSKGIDLPQAAYSDTPPQVYFVDFSATQLTTLASWASTLSSYLPSALMVLVSIPAARILRENSNVNGGDSLRRRFSSVYSYNLTGKHGRYGDGGVYDKNKTNSLRILNLISILFLFSLFIR